MAETNGPLDVVKLPDEDGKVMVRLRVNGRERTVRVASTQTLLETLRDELGLHGARSGCAVGVCGACTVLREGQPIDGCLTLTALCEDDDIVTVEGLESESGELSPVQDAFLRHRAFQCSYCTSGFVLALEALLQRLPQPAEEDIWEALSGHICRCGSYSRIMAAAREFTVDRWPAEHT